MQIAPPQIQRRGFRLSCQSSKSATGDAALRHNCPGPLVLAGRHDFQFSPVHQLTLAADLAHATATCLILRPNQ